jgi:hypothetical protein
MIEKLKGSKQMYIRTVRVSNGCILALECQNQTLVCQIYEEYVAVHYHMGPDSRCYLGISR